MPEQNFKPRGWERLNALPETERATAWEALADRLAAHGFGTTADVVLHTAGIVTDAEWDAMLTRMRSSHAR